MKVIGVDVGGTFTDLIFSDLDTGAMAIHKVPTTPQDPSNGVMKGIEPTPYIFRFAVLEDKQLNAFTIGGGYVYLSSAVLEQAGDVNELAGVMAHEIGHDEKRHIARQNEGQGLSTLVTLLGVAAAIAAKAPEAAIAAQGLNVSLQLKHSREFESEISESSFPGAIVFPISGNLDSPPKSLDRPL